MAIQDQISNHTEEVDGDIRVYCANCGQPESEEREVKDADGNVVHTLTIPPQGYTEEHKLVGLGWMKVGDQLVCTPKCGAALSGEDVGALFDGMEVEQENITPEQVAAMDSVTFESIDDVDDLPEFEEFASAHRVEESSDEFEENQKVEADNE